jgi:hypothetical protein
MSTSTSTSTEVMVGNSVEKIPNVPVCNARLYLDGGCRRHAEKDHENRGNEDANTLDRSDIERFLTEVSNRIATHKHGHAKLI